MGISHAVEEQITIFRPLDLAMCRCHEAWGGSQDIRCGELFGGAPVDPPTEVPSGAVTPGLTPRQPECGPPAGGDVGAEPLGAKTSRKESMHSPTENEKYWRVT